jgi:hypothetical protein
MTSPSTGETVAAPTQMQVGPLTVKADAAHVAEFRRATLCGDEVGRILPFTYPVCWLATPEIRGAVTSLAPVGHGAELLPLHESQAFDYVEPLLADVDYFMNIDIHKEEQPLRLVLRATIGPTVDSVHLRMEMALRIFMADGNDGQIEL